VFKRLYFHVKYSLLGRNGPSLFIKFDFSANRLGLNEAATAGHMVTKARAAKARSCITALRGQDWTIPSFPISSHRYSPSGDRAGGRAAERQIPPTFQKPAHFSF
jgi:hypothetical protein